MDLLRVITDYVALNAEEEAERRSILQFLQKFDEKDWAVRDNLLGHLTSSAWVVNPERTKVLFAFHNIYRSWAWLGGHADGDLDLMRVAQKEAREETGIVSLRPLLGSPIDLSVLNVGGHIKRGAYVPPHLHFNVTYLFEAQESDALRHAPGENAGVAWIAVDGLLEKVSEEGVIPVYRRIMDKVRALPR